MDTKMRFIVALSGAASMVSDDEPLYGISVAAEMAGMHPQTLRQYDRLGLVSPRRTGGGGRRYSLRDVDLLREVQRLSQEEGVNLVGIKRILELESELRALRAHLEALAGAVDPEPDHLPVPVPDFSTALLSVWRAQASD
ncbi:MAG TPA: helix-turn-helix transcriptional regulator [Jiangellaceae bacterium]|nr:helix-turn-helix transcriptional regulator [Jiangellaceae bacterium]